MTAENQNKEPSQERAGDRHLSIQGHADENIVVSGDQTTIQWINVLSPVTVGPATSARSHTLSQQEYRWRQVLVDNVRHYWIEGVLKKSLHHNALIELGLEERNQAVASPLKGVEEFANEQSRPFPDGTQAIDIFDNLGHGRTLLILGGARAGKTMTLLTLMQSLLERIGDDLSQPIPVILNLSSWAKKRQPIAEWLVQKLYETFQVSKSLGASWIQDEQLILCLDGLDEVEVNSQEACVQALNQFINEHGRTEMVVCSRRRDYEVLSGRLNLRSAICIQPLTSEQINRYLTRTITQSKSLETVSIQNLDIEELTVSPFTLSIMGLVCQDYSSDGTFVSISPDTFYQDVFDAYVAQKFQRQDGTYQSKADKAN